MIYTDILSKLQTRKLFAILVDPDKHDEESLQQLAGLTNKDVIDFILVGGSLVSGSVDETVHALKEKTRLPIILFPGNVLQISPNADGILFLSLISGRNPEFLIGNHVIAAPLLKKIDLEIIPTGYILIENGRTTAVEYVSNTKPIPADKIDLAVATAMAGEMLGHKMIYLEAGSGAREPVNTSMIRAVKKSTGIPLIVGGGIHTAEQVGQIYDAGADIIVVGSVIEENTGEFTFLLEFINDLRKQGNSGLTAPVPG
jgi:phosphoglycerol geranylgeranyltransferase